MLYLASQLFNIPFESSYAQIYFFLIEPQLDLLRSRPTTPACIDFATVACVAISGREYFLPTEGDKLSPAALNNFKNTLPTLKCSKDGETTIDGDC